MPLTPADVRTKQFTTTRLRSGYEEAEVDDFLEEVEAELARLIEENEELRAKLAEGPSAHGDPAPVFASPLAAPVAELPPAPVTPAQASIDTAARVLTLAQQTADQALAEASQEAEETCGRARREADEILGQARRQAVQITSDARARAESLDRDVQERHRQAMGSLAQQREELERRVDDLRAFERERRGMLKAYAERLLHDLDASADRPNTGPAAGVGPQLISVGSGAGPGLPSEDEPAGDA